MAKEIKDKVCQANKLLPKYGLVTFTWGNVSAIDRKSNNYAIKPSGVKYDDLTPDDIVVVDINGNTIEGTLRPSSDTKTHMEIYKAFDEVGAIVHTHSSYATAWAQAGRNIPCLGTTHADYFYGEIPCLRFLNAEEVSKGYEANTGKLIVEYFKVSGRKILDVPAILCSGHGVFAWGKDVFDAVHNAVVVEEVAKMAYMTKMLNEDVSEIPQHIQDKHYYRKHGENAYYGQEF